MTIKIALTGKAGVGKDTFADYLVKYHGFVKIAFADPLKDTLKNLFNFSHEQLYGHLKEVVDEEWNVSPREVMQKFGTDIIRDQFTKIFPQLKLDKDSFWIHRLGKTLDTNKSERIIVTDARFDNEIEFLKERGFGILRITRNNLKSSSITSHSSENGVTEKNYNHIIDNNGSVDKLYKEADLIVMIYKMFTEDCEDQTER